MLDTTPVSADRRIGKIVTNVMIKRLPMGECQENIMCALIISGIITYRQYELDMIQVTAVSLGFHFQSARYCGIVFTQFRRVNLGAYDEQLPSCASIALGPVMGGCEIYE